MITLQDYLINPLHVAAISPAAEASMLRSTSTFSFKVILSGGNEIVFQFDNERLAAEELVRIRQLIDQASTRR